MRLTAIIVTGALLMATAAYAVQQRLYVPGVETSMGGRDMLLTTPGAVIPPPACSNDFTFTDACNSQYIGGFT